MNSNTFLQFISCQGYNLDNNVSELLGNSKFLTYIFKKFLCVFIHKNFKVKIEDNKEKNALCCKQKILKFIYKSINKNPVLDISLIVYMKTLLSSGLKDEEKKILKANIFGREPPINFLEHFSNKLQININLINLDTNEELKNFNKKLKKVQDIEMNFCYNDGSFSLVYGIDKATDIFSYEKVSD